MALSPCLNDDRKFEMSETQLALHVFKFQVYVKVWLLLTSWWPILEESLRIRLTSPPSTMTSLLSDTVTGHHEMVSQGNMMIIQGRREGKSSG